MSPFLDSFFPAALWLLPIAALMIGYWAQERRSIHARMLDGEEVVRRRLWFRLPWIAPAAKTTGASATRAMTSPAGRTRADLASEMHKLAIARAEDAIRWYDAGRTQKKHLGAGLRLLAIILTAGAGLHPLLTQVFTLAPPLDNSVVPSVLVALAALFVLFDRFGGHTSGWIRFMKAQTSIDQALAAYKAGWLSDRGIEPDIDEARLQALTQRSLRLIAHVDQTVRDETDEWAAEFRKALMESERAVEDARRRLDSGSLEVEVANYAEIPGGRWTLKVADGAERTIVGARAAETDIPVGMQPVRVSTRVGGVLCQDERAVDVRAGAITAVEVTFVLPAAVEVGAEMVTD